MSRFAPRCDKTTPLSPRATPPASSSSPRRRRVAALGRPRLASEECRRRLLLRRRRMRCCWIWPPALALTVICRTSSSCTWPSHQAHRPSAPAPSHSTPRPPSPSPSSSPRPSSRWTQSRASAMRSSSRVRASVTPTRPQPHDCLVHVQPVARYRFSSPSPAALPTNQLPSLLRRHRIQCGAVLRGHECTTAPPHVCRSFKRCFSGSLAGPFPLRIACCLVQFALHLCCKERKKF
mmetsp:Transcript_13146/g.22690  ORF Transcript_13146/g.22690 Transcript_13146/m.22690 type:complete len:235 (-) Transcript_13146:38-742(-)